MCTEMTGGLVPSAILLESSSSVVALWAELNAGHRISKVPNRDHMNSLILESTTTEHWRSDSVYPAQSVESKPTKSSNSQFDLVHRDHAGFELLKAGKSCPGNRQR
jgi:hypothetical protein